MGCRLFNQDAQTCRNQTREDSELELNTQANQAVFWTAADLHADQSWVYHLNDQHREELVHAVRNAHVEGKDLLDYCARDFSIDATRKFLQAPLSQVQNGPGIALVKGLPREGVTEKEFELITWAVGLHSGTPRPQGKATQYISAVRDVGMDYRTGTGRGYSSNADLDFHTDSSDVIFLTCYNKARSGGMSLITSSMSAFREMLRRHPDQAKYLFEPIAFSRQGEQAPGEGPFVLQPIFSECNGAWFGRWNWNRVRHGLQIDGAPKLSEAHINALHLFDEIVRSQELAYNMWLEPGDMQILNSHVTLHSRTEFEDFEDPASKRLLFRLWIAPPSSQELPACWEDLYGSCKAGAVRGGIKGFEYGARQQHFDERQASDAGMTLA